MPRRGYFAPGGQKSLVDRSGTRGVYAEHPALSPKYNTGNRLSDTQARLLILVSLDEYYDLLQNPDVPTKAKDIVRKMGVVPSSEDDSAYVGGAGIVDFLLTGFSLQFSEQLQVSEVLADAYAAYYFGQSAPRAQLSGILLNTRQDNWFDDWYYLYQEWIRGTKLATRRQQVILKVDTRFYFGSLFNLQTQFSGQLETAVNFSAGMLVKRISVQRQASQVSITTDRSKAAALSTQFVELNAKNTDAVEVQNEQGTAVARDKTVAVSRARITVGSAIKAAAVGADGEAIVTEGLTSIQTSAAGVAALESRYKDRSIPEDELESVNASMPPVGEKESVNASVGPERLYSGDP